jgi:hypothetical protein
MLLFGYAAIETTRNMLSISYRHTGLSALELDGLPDTSQAMLFSRSLEEKHCVRVCPSRLAQRE